MRFLVEHYRAVENPGTALGVGYIATGRSEEVEAHAEADAAAVALSEEGDVVEADTIDYDPGNDLYAFAGEEEAVRVTALGAPTA